MKNLHYDIKEINKKEINKALSSEEIWCYTQQDNGKFKARRVNTFIKKRLEEESTSTAKTKCTKTDETSISKGNNNQATKRNKKVSNSIVMISSHVISDADSFKASLITGLNTESDLQTLIENTLDSVATNAEASKLKDSSVSISASLIEKSDDKNEKIDIKIDSSKKTSTVIIPQSISMSLDVTVTDSGKAKNEIPVTFSNTQNLSLSEPIAVGMVQVNKALQSFCEGKAFETNIISFTVKNSESDGENSSY